MIIKSDNVLSKDLWSLSTKKPNGFNFRKAHSLENAGPQKKINKHRMRIQNCCQSILTSFDKWNVPLCSFSRGKP